MKTTIFRLMMAVGVSACFASAGYAAKAELASSEVALITAPDGSESRLLVRFEVSELAEGHEVYYADITFHVPGLTDLQEFELVELGAAWTGATVKWEELCGSPDGDLRGDIIGYWITDERTGDLVKFVVTESVSRLVSDVSSNNGFAIKTVGENPQRLELPSESPVLTIYSGPRFSRRH